MTTSKRGGPALLGHSLDFGKALLHVPEMRATMAPRGPAGTGTILSTRALPDPANGRALLYYANSAMQGLRFTLDVNSTADLPWHPLKGLPSVSLQLNETGTQAQACHTLPLSTVTRQTRILLGDCSGMPFEGAAVLIAAGCCMHFGNLPETAVCL